MPKKPNYKIPMSKRSTLSVSGLSVEDILSMSPEKINKLNDADLTSIAKRLVSASNKRIRRLRASDYGKYAPALANIPETGFSVNIQKGGNHRNRVMEELANMRNFMSLKTSSLKGFKKLLSDFHKKYNTPLDPAQSSDFWKGYREFASTGDGYALAMEDSEKAVKLYTDEYNANMGTIDGKTLEDKARELYENKEVESHSVDPSNYLFGDEDYGDEL